MTGTLRPLHGLRILVTRPRGQSRQLCARLEAEGAIPIAIPTIRIVPPHAGGPLDQALRRLAHYGWVIVTSANGAKACASRARALEITPTVLSRPHWAAIGPATARVLRAAGIPVAMTPSRYLTGSIASEIGTVEGQRILLPRTDVAPPGLADALRTRGAIVDEVSAYRTELAPPRSRARIRQVVAGGGADVVVLTSASTMRGLVRLLGEDRRALHKMEIACIGPVTAAAVTEEGFTPTVVADEHTVDGLVRALVTHHRPSRGEAHARCRAAR